MTRTLLAAAALLLAAPPLTAQQGAPPLPREARVASAVAPLPEELREGATVLAPAPGPGMEMLHAGDGAFVCLADDPADDRFHVACYHRSLEPFMARGRALRAEGHTEAVDSIRNAEILAGRLRMPEHPAALYSLTGPPESVDPATGAVTGARPLYVVYVPFATAESTGLPTKPAPGVPWLMNPGTPRAHIMYVPARPEARPNSP